MIIQGKEFVPAPEGVHNAVCVDVVDLGMVTSQFGTQPKLKVVWEIEAAMSDGKPFLVSKRYTVSLHEKANLAKDLKSWRGKAFTSDELKAFDTEKLVGAHCQLVVAHTESDGQVYANVNTVIKAGEKKLQPSGKYTRIKDRPPQQSQRNGVPANREPAYNPTATANDIPF